MAHFSLVLEDDGVVGFYPIKNAGEVTSDEHVEKLYEKAMRNSYIDREVWDRPRLIGVVKGVVNWFDPRLGNDMEYSRQKFVIK
tara:strand:- start:47 stop:298 length:252 start_codon:yes stop_codon:yes gene_type:complete